MAHDPNPRVRTITLSGGRHWLARAALTVAGLALLVLAFFFITMALAAGAVAGAVLAARWWWRSRRREAEAENVVEGEYVVVERETPARIGTPAEPPPQPPELTKDR